PGLSNYARLGLVRDNPSRGLPISANGETDEMIFERPSERPQFTQSPAAMQALLSRQLPRAMTQPGDDKGVPIFVRCLPGDRSHLRQAQEHLFAFRSRSRELDLEAGT